MCGCYIKANLTEQGHPAELKVWRSMTGRLSLGMTGASVTVVDITLETSSSSGYSSGGKG